MIRNRLIKWLGGFTEHEWRMYVLDRDITAEKLRTTIKELSDTIEKMQSRIIRDRKELATYKALIPVSAVTVNYDGESKVTADFHPDFSSVAAVTPKRKRGRPRKNPN